ncbi:MAG: hypothetical protein ACOYNB_11515 [Aquabacterium sp.]|uniref:hypothetical protein n=1 Tax=Aquabacterium sp. TaxID=1872578 RepID=UPI003BCC66C5
MTTHSSAKVLLATLLTLGLSGCGEIYRYFRSGEVGWALKQELRDRNVEKISLAKLTRFAWDELFLFGPYEPESDVCKTLRLSPADCKSAIKATSTDDGELLLVFRRHGAIVHSEIHIRWHGDFSPIPEAPLTPETAVFSVVVQGKGASGEDWLVLRPVSVQSPGTLKNSPASRQPDYS